MAESAKTTRKSAAKKAVTRKKAAVKKAAAKKPAAKAPAKPAKKKLSGKKLCKLAKKGKIDKLAALAAGAKYICANCGRVSSQKANCCKPVKLG